MCHRSLADVVRLRGRVFEELFIRRASQGPDCLGQIGFVLPDVRGHEVLPLQEEMMTSGPLLFTQACDAMLVNETLERRPEQAPR